MESVGRLMAGLEFYRGRRVFLTGHTGFKGAWMCELLKSAGADLTGYALAPPTSPGLFELLRTWEGMKSVIADIRDLDTLKRAVAKADPQVVIHMAAQPIVGQSYSDPVYTYETNVMGTVHILEAVRQAKGVRSVLNVTTDKVYKNGDGPAGCRETDELGGLDPYSSSKSCAELVTEGYRASFFSGGDVAVSTVRAGNSIGGGDFAPGRIIPDCARAAMQGRTIIVRNPHSVRPYQHVLESLTAYLEIARRQYGRPSLSGSYNVGPDAGDCLTTGRLTTLFCDAWGGVGWQDASEKNAFAEAGSLRLDCSKARAVFGLRPVWPVGEAVRRTVEWYRCYGAGGDTAECARRQVTAFLKAAGYVD